MLGAVCMSNTVLAQGYQRKQVQPNFFIPEGSLQPKTEKLPPVQYSQPAMDMPATGAEEKTYQNNTIIVPVHKTASTKAAQQTEAPLPGFEKYTPQQDPLYLHKYDEYINDLKVIGEKGAAPANKNLNNDLAKMNSNGRFIVDDSFGTLPEKPKIVTKSIKRY